MAKEVYGIPDSLDKKWTDTELALQNSEGIGLQPMPLGYLLTLFASAFCLLFVVMKTWVGSMPTFFLLMFIVLWVLLTFILLKRDKTGEPQYTFVKSIFEYLPKNKRFVFTRKHNDVGLFYSMVGIQDIDQDTGLITFIDGTVGYMYLVVGSASILLFDEDKNAILDRVDKFYRKVAPNVQFIYLTEKQAQRVDRQLNKANERKAQRTVDDVQLNALYDAEIDALRLDVGSAFTSIHQYMIVKAENMEELQRAKVVLNGELRDSSMMFKRCKALFDDEIEDVLRDIFTRV